MFNRLKSTLFGSRKRKIATITASLVLAGAGTALAAWIVSATGTGAGSVANLTAPTIVAGTPTGAGILAGGDGDALIKITNPNNVDLTITDVIDGGSSTAFSGGCMSSLLSVNTKTALTIPVPKNATNLSVTIPNAYHLSNAAPSTCMGQTFTKGVALTFATA